MNTSGDAADQVMRMMLNGTEVLVKLTGAGAKQTAVLIYTILKQQNKTKGAERLTNMLRSGKKLLVYTFKDQDLEMFKKAATQYGVLYTILKDKYSKDGVFDVMVRADDESKLARMSERFNLTHIDTASLRAELIRERSERGKGGQEKAEPDKSEPTGEATEKQGEEKPETAKEQPAEAHSQEAADNLLGENEGKPVGEQSHVKEKQTTENPTMARREDSSTQAPSMTSNRPSEQPSQSSEKVSDREVGHGGKSDDEQKPSVRAELARIKREQDAKKKKEGEVVKDTPIKTNAPKREDKAR